MKRNGMLMSRKMVVTAAIVGLGAGVLSGPVAFAASGDSSPGAPSRISPRDAAPGAIFGWGSTAYNQTKIPNEMRDGASKVVGGNDTAFGLKGGKVYSWGYAADTTLKVPAGLEEGVTDIAAAAYTGFALKNGSVVAW